ncbi:FAD-dependent thymidylate synthase [Komagataeibacter xylinus]|uniref:FAD-dependent thymidylate synthase n=1 Tax=Komagataeibacter xylinus TaxID=28448 RepID=UPI00280A6CE9|nr:FAD-dependent thymidylate synthase [Komagataeibacter xylinus]
MTITATSILASISNAGKRIDTLLLRYPRFIHAEFMTHRQFSRNASSSRAIPVERLIVDVDRDQAVPVFWGMNQTGMQAREEMSIDDRSATEMLWHDSAKYAVETARLMAGHGAHKQIVNRILEPFAHINVVVTATEWDNFMDLRDHEDAQPEIRALAQTMKSAISTADTQHLYTGQWHLPFVTPEEIREYQGLMDPTRNLRAVSSARCARTSYLTHDGRQSSLAEDVALGERLTKSRPFHASPFEHQSTPYVPSFHDETDQRNFRGWVQNRSLMEKSL